MAGKLDYQQKAGVIMKRRLWQWLEASGWKSNVKTGLFITGIMLLMCAAGVILWIPVSMFFPGIDVFICLAGYLVFFAGYVGSIMYLCNHEFS